MAKRGGWTLGVGAGVLGAVWAATGPVRAEVQPAVPSAPAGTATAGEKAVVKAADVKPDAPLKVTTDAALLASGKKVFLRNCSKCHGPKGDGKGEAASELKTKPRNFLKDPFQHGSSDEELFRTISEGIPKTDMQAWKDSLSEKARRAAIEYVKWLKAGSPKMGKA